MIPIIIMVASYIGIGIQSIIEIFNGIEKYNSNNTFEEKETRFISKKRSMADVNTNNIFEKGQSKIKKNDIEVRKLW